MVCCGRVTLTFVEESEAKKKHRCNVNFSIWDSQYHDVMVSFHCNIEILCFSDCRLRFNLWIFYHCYVMVSIPEKNTYMICVCVIIVENSNNFKTKNQIGCNLILHSYSLHPHSRVPFIFLSVLSPTKPWFTGVFFRQMMNAENRVTSRSPVTASSSTSVGTCCKVPGWKLKRYDMLLEDQHFPRRPFKKKPWMIWEPSYNRVFSLRSPRDFGDESRILPDFNMLRCNSMGYFSADQIWESQWSAGHSPITHQSTRDPVLPLAEP